jgi:MFS family permease
MRLLSRFGAKSIAALLAYLLSVQSAVAAVQSVQVQTGALPVSAAGAVGASLRFSQLFAGSLSFSAIPLQSLSAPSLSAVPTVSASGLRVIPAAPQAQTLPEGLQAGGPAVIAAAPPAAATLLAAPAAEAKAPLAEAVRKLAEGRIQPATQAAAEAVRGVEKTSSDGSRSAAERQFSVLTGEIRTQGASDVEDPVSATRAPELGGAISSTLQAAGERKAEPKAEVPAAAQAKGSFTQVFKDPERNHSFWRYVLGSAIFSFGIEMYTVGLPYLVEAFTQNSLRENHDPRTGNAETMQSLVRQNRSLVRIAHWVAQAFSYATIPLFTRNSDGSLKWLPRAFWVRSAVLTGIVGLFFATGLFSVSTVLYSLLALIAVQSFFQGLSVTLEGVGVNRMLGDKSVTDSERMKANAILTFVSSAIAIIGPAIAGQISMVKDLLGKTGVGGAIIYGIYGICTGIAGLIYATVKIFTKKSDSAAAKDQPAAEKLSVKGVFKNLGDSLKDGVKLVFSDRFLRTSMIMSLISSLFSDPLIFNVLPEYVENLVKANPGTIGAALHLPVVGWVLKGMTSTPMGFFSLLVVFSSLGSILASMLMEPIRKLLNKLGFKSEESMTIPLYALAALEIPLFWLMISVPSMWLVLPLYGLQAFLGSFVGMVISGVNQKKMGTYTGPQVNKVLSAESFLGILASIVSTFLYGFVLTNIPIATALLIAAVATTVYGAFQLVSPWLSFTKEQRRRNKESSAK